MKRFIGIAILTSLIFLVGQNAMAQNIKFGHINSDELIQSMPEFDSAQVKHPPFESGDCLTCHSPHSSNNKTLLVANTKKLCLSCHEPKFAKDHPVQKHPVEGVKDPRQPKNELSCVSCHNPHASAHPKLFEKAAGMYQLCQECHKK